MQRSRLFGFVLISGIVSCAASGAVISGTVKDADGKPFKGAFVRAHSQTAKTTTIVLTGPDGRYLLNAPAEGEYQIEAAAPGFKGGPETATVNSAKPAEVNFSLQKAPVRWQDLSIYQGKELLPDGTGKDVLFSQCMSCHGLQTKIAATRMDEDSWRSAVAYMRDYKNGVGDKRFSDQDAKDVASYLAKTFGTDSDLPRYPTDLPAYEKVKQPEVSDEATKITYVEYDLPGPNRTPWEATPDWNNNGHVWFVESWAANKIARLDLKTGEITEFGVPLDPNRRMLHIHSVVEAPDGNVWFAEAFECQLSKFNPKTNKFSFYKPPSCLKSKAGEEGGQGSSEVRVDRFGNIWANAGNMWRFDPKTEKFTEFPEGGSAYGFVFDTKDGNVWFTQLPDGKIGMIDIKTLKLKRWTPPMTLKLAEQNKDLPTDPGNWNGQIHPRTSGPRRISSDSKGKIWFSEWYGNQVGSFDPVTETFKEYPLPGPSPRPYGLGVDQNDYVWYASFDTDVLGRLDPTTGNVVEFPFPHSGNEIRELLKDSQGRIWYGTPFNNKIGYFVPPEVPAK